MVFHAHRALLVVGCLVALTATSLMAKEPQFVSLMPKGDQNGWEKSVIITPEGYLDGDGCYIAREFSDFTLKFEFLQTPGANSGMGIRTVKGENAAYSGMEIQCLEDTHEKYNNLKEWQYHGSIYGVVAAKRGALKPPGEWNEQTIKAYGNRITVILNGVTIVDADLEEVAPGGKTIDEREHPGLFKKSGYLRLCGHGGGVQFRNIEIAAQD